MGVLGIYYLGHSAWAVETDKRYLLFDIQDENVKKNGKLDDGFIDISLLNGKPVYVFFSHRHHDHYSPALHGECVKRADAFVVLGGFTVKTATTQTVSMNPREKYEAGSVTVHTAASTDEGVCFLVQTDGLNIFHAGDNADWGDGEQNDIYCGEIDYLAGIDGPVDIAFIPVCTFSGQRPKNMTDGAVYAIKRLAPKVTYPMHGNGREHLYEAFERDLRKTDGDARVVTVRKKGIAECP
jgi:L-ascorbate metabolism protein UlaG (beta-lactamase superfamily)